MEKSIKNCVFCLATRLVAINIRGKVYVQCLSCGGISLDSEFFPSAEVERKRYEMHCNSPDDKDFRTYLEDFIDPVLASVTRYAERPVRTVFDYGSGPQPVLLSILSARGYDTRGWDPFFAPQTIPFEGGADLVVCHEVAEHFFEPRRDFTLMAGCIKPGGFLAVGTMTLPEDNSSSVRDYFISWWYRQDCTHVSFYSPSALRSVGEFAGLEWLGQSGKNSWLFRRPAQ